MALPPSAGQLANRRLLTFILAAVGILSFFIMLGRSSTDTTPIRSFKPHGSSNSKSNSKSNGVSGHASYSDTPIHHVNVDKGTLAGGAIMPKLGNETLKAELGRAAWKLFHTTMARFPDAPTEDEQTALYSYIHLFARLYPCGECAGHFRQILQSYPPQVSSRGKAAVWACFVHNEVNQSLGKPEFDCANIGDFYDCGCAEDDDDKKKEGGAKTTAKAGGDNASEDLERPKAGELKLEREGKTLGG